MVFGINKKNMIIRIIKRLRLFKKTINDLYNYIIFKINKITYGNNFKINGKIYISNNGIARIGDNFRANSGKNNNPIGGDTILRLIVKKGAKLTIGNNVGISNSTIYSAKQIVIGNNVLIGGGCRIWDTNFHSLNPIIRFNGDYTIKSSPVFIEDNVFIGGSTIILKGVKIGKNSIIGAGSVVTKSVPANEIWAGNPAIYIKKLNIGK